MVPEGVQVRIAWAAAVDEEINSPHRSRLVRGWAAASLPQAVAELKEWASHEGADQRREDHPWVIEWWDKTAQEWVYVDHVD